jgi:hypothetical protein
MQRKGAALPKSGDNTFAAACGGDVAGDKRQQVSFDQNPAEMSHCKT